MGSCRGDNSVWLGRGWGMGGEDARETVGTNREGICVLWSLNSVLQAVEEPLKGKTLFRCDV